MIRGLRRGATVLLWACVLAAGGTGCASLDASSPSAVAPDREGPMTQARLERIFAEQVDAIEGPPGMLRTIVDGFDVYLISEPGIDRMRMISRIAPSDRLPPRFLTALLEANFHRTLDARYAVSEGVVFGLYQHPISTLRREEIVSAFRQVVALARNFGTSFSSEGLEPGPDPTR